MDWPLARIATGIVRAASLVTYLADIQLGGSPTLLTNVAVAHHIAALAADDIVLVILPSANLPTPAPLVLAVIKTSLPASSAETITGLKTFDRDPDAPFAVTAGSALVTNLNADLLDDLDTSSDTYNTSVAKVLKSDADGGVRLDHIEVGSATGAGEGDVKASARHYTVARSVANCINGLWSTLYTFANLPGLKMFLVMAGLNAHDTTNYAGWGIVATDEASGRMVTKAVGGLLDLQMSGLALQAKQSSSCDQTIFVTIQRFG